MVEGNPVVGAFFRNHSFMEEVMVEQDLFGQHPLNDVEFVQGPKPGSVPLPDTLPPPPKLSELPHDVLKSTTVESLIAQNEDMMARLKVALRRLSIIELENRKLVQEVEQSRHEVAVAADQVLVYKEKDGAWKAKLEDVTKERDILKETRQALTVQNREFAAEIERFTKYQETIQTQVKPYVDELKEYSKSLEAKTKSLEEEAERKDGLIRDLRLQIAEVTRNSKYQLEQTEARNHELIDSYEQSIKDYQSELTLLRESHRELELKTARLSKTEQRANELENQLIEIQRSKDELVARFETEAARLSEKSDNMVRDYARLSVESQDLSKENATLKGKLEGLEFAKGDLLTQLESLRYLWQGKNEETEKLKISLTALEKLNLELSAKIQELRERG